MAGMVKYVNEIVMGATASLLKDNLKNRKDE
jgi:hypothetical protein